jgi:hypothetical protein
MDTALNLPLPAAAVSSDVSPIERAITTKVQALEKTDRPATLPPDRPFVAQAVSARLSVDDIPDDPTEIMPAERTLRPYDVPMLPFDATEDTNGDTPPPETGAAGGNTTKTS